MHPLERLLLEGAAENGIDAQRHALVVAPELGGDYTSSGVGLQKGPYSADLGKYATRNGDNYYGYVGAQPLKLGDVSIGGAIGGYMNSRTLNAQRLLGLLLSTPIANGSARLMVSPTDRGADVFLGLEKPF